MAPRDFVNLLKQFLNEFLYPCKTIVNQSSESNVIGEKTRAEFSCYCTFKPSSGLACERFLQLKQLDEYSWWLYIKPFFGEFIILFIGVSPVFCFSEISAKQQKIVKENNVISGDDSF